MTKIIWRLARAIHGPGLSGQGGLFASGRWHTRGIAVSYWADSPSLAALEVLAHLSRQLLPADLTLYSIALPTACTLQTISATMLPNDWQHAYDYRVTETWAQRVQTQGDYAGFVIPSVVMPEQNNIVLFGTPQVSALSVQSSRTFYFDERLWKTQ